jgi:hypothetical protein
MSGGFVARATAALHVDCQPVSPVPWTGQTAPVRWMFIVMQANKQAFHTCVVAWVRALVRMKGAP